MARFLILALSLFVTSVFAQDPVSDSLRRELKIMELKIKQMELNRLADPSRPIENPYYGYPKLAEHRWAKYYNANKNITLNGYGIFVGGLELGYERVFNNHVGIRLIAGYYTSENPPFYNFATYYEGYRGEIQTRWYLEKGANSTAGIPFFLVSASYKSIYLRQDETKTNFFGLTNSNSIIKSNSSCVYPSALFGYRRHVYKGFFAEITAGIAYNIILENSGKSNVHIPIVNPYTTATQFRSTFSVGSTF